MNSVESKEMRKKNKNENLLQYTWEIQHNLHLIINSEWLLFVNIHFMFIIEKNRKKKPCCELCCGLY